MRAGEEKHTRFEPSDLEPSPGAARLWGQDLVSEGHAVHPGFHLLTGKVRGIRYWVLLLKGLL